MTAETMRCRSCGNGIHPQEPRKCRTCHGGRGLCVTCYRRSAAAGTLHTYPLSTRRSRQRRECRHGGIHRHGTAVMYTADECRCPDCGAAQARKMNRWRLTVARIGPVLVDATGTRRRLQALAAIGWSPTFVAGHTGLSGDVAWRIINATRTRVRRGTADRIAATYRDLSVRPAPRRAQVSRTVNWAAAQGWLPPVWWDDDTIDDPEADPQTADLDDLVDEVAVHRFVTGEHGIRLNRPERVEAARLMLAAGWPRNRLQRVFRMNGKTWGRLLAEALTEHGHADSEGVAA